MAVRGQLRDPRGGPGRRRSLAAAAGVLAALLGFAAPVGAAPNQLTQGTVSPVVGTTATPFAFMVQYLGRAPSGVVAIAGSTVIPLSLSSGTPEDGTWSGSAFLPAGSHPVSFQATARGNSASLDGPTVTVTPAPPPNLGPTPPPSPGATAPPTPAPATPAPTSPPGGRPPPLAPTPLPAGRSPASTPSALPSPGAGGFVGGVVRTPRPSPTGRRASVESPPAVADGDPLTVVAAAMVAAVILAMIALVALARDRRRRLPDRPLPHLAAPPGVAANASMPHPGPAARRAEWEAAALDDLPIGTVEYEPPPRAEG